MKEQKEIGKNGEAEKVQLTVGAVRAKRLSRIHSMRYPKVYPLGQVQAASHKAIPLGNRPY